MTAIKKLLAGILLLSGFSSAALADDSQTTTYQTPVTKTDFVSKASQNQYYDGANDNGHGDMFLIKIADSFFPEKYGAYHTTTTQNNTTTYKTSVNDTYFQNAVGYDANSDKKYANYVFDVSVGAVVKLTPAATTSNASDHRKGHVYGYDGDLSRFMYVMRSTQAYSGAGDDIAKYNPYKFYKSQYEFVQSNPAFIEFSLLAKNIKSSCVNDGTLAWQTAYEGGTSMIETLKSVNIQEVKSYHYKSVIGKGTYIGSTATNYEPQASDWKWDWTYEYNSGHYDGDGCVSEGTETATATANVTIKKSSIITWDQEYTGTGTTTYDKLYRVDSGLSYGKYVITHDCINGTMRGHYMHMNPQTGVTDFTKSGSTINFNTFKANTVPATEGEVFLFFVPNFGDDGLFNTNTFKEKYQPYIQLYKGLIWHSRDCAPEEGSTQDDNLLANGWQHDIKWVDTAMDKFLNGGEVYTVERRRINNDGSAGEWEVYDSNLTSHEKTQMVNMREDDDYWYEYRVKCTIESIGLSVYTNVVKLIVPGFNLRDVDFTVTSHSVAEDINNATIGYGINHVTHKLDITLSNSTSNNILTKVKAGQGVFEIKHNGTTILTLTGTGTAYKYKDANNNEYTFSQDGKLSFDANTVNYNYNVDGTGLDKYQIAFKENSSSQDVKSTAEKTAPFYRTTFTASPVNNQTIGTNLYYYADKIEWITTTENIERYTANSVGDNGTFSFAGDIVNNNITSETVNKLTGVESSSTPHTNIYVGYIKFDDSSIAPWGTWGLGYDTATHNIAEIPGSLLNSFSYPRNRVLTVQQYKEHDTTASGATSPMWNSPIASVTDDDYFETKQIFPGTQIDFTVDAIPTGRGDANDKFVAEYAVVIYKITKNADGEETVARVTPDGAEYSAALDATQTGSTLNGVYIPVFEADEYVVDGLQQKDVLYNFEDGADYRYDAFVFYRTRESGAVSSYAHSGYGLAKTDLLQYVKGLPEVKHEPVVHPQEQKFSYNDVKAAYLHEGGFSYLVMDMTNAIPDATKEKPAKVAGSHSETDMLNDAVTSYEISVKQGEAARNVYVPNVPSDYDQASMTAENPFEGVSLNLDSETNINSALYVYPEIVNQNLVFAQDMNNHVNMSGKFMLLGINGIELAPKNQVGAPHKATVVDGNSTSADPKALLIPLSIKVKPIYTICDPEYPVMLPYNDRPTILYKSDNRGNSVKNEIRGIRPSHLPNGKNTLDYGATSKQEQTLEENASVNYLRSGVISGIEGVEIGDVKVYAEGLTIVVEGEAELVVVFDASAKQVYAGNEHRIEVAQPGVYVVATGGKIYKVFVK